jgi:hypothetical protein
MLKPLLPEPRRKEIFLALVQAQDGGASVKESRNLVANQFGVSVQEVRLIEQDGLAEEWPPL